MRKFLCSMILIATLAFSEDFCQILDFKEYRCRDFEVCGKPKGKVICNRDRMIIRWEKDVFIIAKEKDYEIYLEKKGKEYQIEILKNDKTIGKLFFNLKGIYRWTGKYISDQGVENWEKGLKKYEFIEFVQPIEIKKEDFGNLLKLYSKVISLRTKPIWCAKKIEKIKKKVRIGDIKIFKEKEAVVFEFLDKKWFFIDITGDGIPEWLRETFSSFNQNLYNLYSPSNEKFLEVYYQILRKI